MPKIKNQTHLRDALWQLAQAYVEEVNSPDYLSGKIPKIPLNRTYVAEFQRIDEQYRRIHRTTIHDKIQSRDIFSLLRRVLQIIQDFKVPAKAAAWFECERDPQTKKLIFKKAAADESKWTDDWAHPLVDFLSGIFANSNNNYLKRYKVWVRDRKGDFRSMSIFVETGKPVPEDFYYHQMTDEEILAFQNSFANKSPKSLFENTLYENLLFFSQQFNNLREQMPWWRSGRYIAIAPRKVGIPFAKNRIFFSQQMCLFHWMVDHHDLSELPMKDCSKEEIYQRMIEVINVIADTYAFLNMCQYGHVFRSDFGDTSTSWKYWLGNIPLKLFWWKSHTLWAQNKLKKWREANEKYYKQLEDKEQRSNDRFYENYLNCRDVTLHDFLPKRPGAHVIEASFEKDGLWIDHFDVSNSEHWKYCVKNWSLGRLREAFGVETRNKQTLLEAIADRYKGETAYNDLQNYLNSQNIPYHEMAYRA